MGSVPGLTHPKAYLKKSTIHQCIKQGLQTLKCDDPTRFAFALRKSECKLCSDYSSIDTGTG